jgi:hypothetical protein
VIFDKLREIRKQQNDLLVQVDELNLEYQAGAITRHEFVADRKACYDQLNTLEDLAADLRNSEEGGFGE